MRGIEVASCVSIWTTLIPSLAAQPSASLVDDRFERGHAESNPEPRSETPPPPAGLRVFQRPADVVRLRETSVHAAVRRKVVSHVVIAWFETSTKTWWPDTSMDEKRPRSKLGAA
jgi:hypothetical protein